MLLAPTANDTRSSLADWLELHALFSERRLSSKGDLLNALDIADDDRPGRFSHDMDTNEDLDQGILEESRTTLLQNVFEELEFRSSCLKVCYPFTVDSRRMVVRAQFQPKKPHFGQVAYAFCLLATALREKTIAPIDDQANIEQELALLFQVCACIAAGGYFGGAVSSFGFPRAEGNAFLPALKLVYQRFGHGDVKDAIEEGHPHATKDAGIDVIAWRDHPDRLPGKLYSLGQCASGKNWKHKPVSSEIEPFHGTWFTTSPATFCVPALYIPFLVYDDLEEPQNDSFTRARVRKVAYHERKFGIIFDRLRIAHHVAECMRTPSIESEAVDGKGRALDVAIWVNQVVEKVSRRGSVA